MCGGSPPKAAPPPPPPVPVVAPVLGAPDPTQDANVAKIRNKTGKAQLQIPLGGAVSGMTGLGIPS